MALTYDEVKALASGTEVLVSWSGCNKPERYKINNTGQWGPWPAAVKDGLFQDHIGKSDEVTLP